jgi:hypothetical protein
MVVRLDSFTPLGFARRATDGDPAGERIGSAGSSSVWASLGRFEGEQLGPVLAQPGALLAPVRAAPLDERPEAPRVVGDAQVAELVRDRMTLS